eukprot:TRINITY_DN59110_c0_g1_i3.p1 TRINITY_DN59110_c0_g1~~TRINITY_DN59110_c0_g1_i3.p1  ORF type:complete len:689 (-),score=174.49 TRINITY_DN59110_c0_g1_i3:1238-3256(-)
MQYADPGRAISPPPGRQYGYMQSPSASAVSYPQYNNQAYNLANDLPPQDLDLTSPRHATGDNSAKKKESLMSRLVNAVKGNGNGHGPGTTTPGRKRGGERSRTPARETVASYQASDLARARSASPNPMGGGMYGGSGMGYSSGASGMGMYSNPAATQPQGATGYIEGGTTAGWLDPSQMAAQQQQPTMRSSTPTQQLMYGQQEQYQSNPYALAHSQSAVQIAMSEQQQLQTANTIGYATTAEQCPIVVQQQPQQVVQQPVVVNQQPQQAQYMQGPNGELYEVFTGANQPTATTTVLDSTGATAQAPAVAQQQIITQQPQVVYVTPDGNPIAAPTTEVVQTATYPQVQTTQQQPQQQIYTTTTIVGGQPQEVYSSTMGGQEVYSSGVATPGGIVMGSVRSPTPTGQQQFAQTTASVQPTTVRSPSPSVMAKMGVEYTQAPQTTTTTLPPFVTTTMTDPHQQPTTTTTTQQHQYVTIDESKEVFIHQQTQQQMPAAQSSADVQYLKQENEELKARLEKQAAEIELLKKNSQPTPQQTFVVHQQPQQVQAGAVQQQQMQQVATQQMGSPQASVVNVQQHTATVAPQSPSTAGSTQQMAGSTQNVAFMGQYTSTTDVNQTTTTTTAAAMQATGWARNATTQGAAGTQFVHVEHIQPQGFSAPAKSQSYHKNLQSID